MGMAQLVVAAVVVERRSKSEVARQIRGLAPLGDHAGPAVPGRGRGRVWNRGLVGRCEVRGAHRSPVEDEIVKIRKELDRAGHEAGAATIAFHLEQRHGDLAGGLDHLAT